MTTAGIRVGSLSVDGTPISSTDLARIEAEEKLHEEMQIKTVRVVAGVARDAAECRSILDMLGIDDSAVLAARNVRGPAASSAAAAPRKGKGRVAAA